MARGNGRGPPFGSSRATCASRGTCVTWPKALSQHFPLGLVDRPHHVCHRHAPIRSAASLGHTSRSHRPGTGQRALLIATSLRWRCPNDGNAACSRAPRPTSPSCKSVLATPRLAVVANPCGAELDVAQCAELICVPIISCTVRPRHHRTQREVQCLDLARTGPFRSLQRCLRVERCLRLPHDAFRTTNMFRHYSSRSCVIARRFVNSGLRSKHSC